MESASPVPTRPQRQQHVNHTAFNFFSLPFEIQKVIYGHIAQDIQNDESFQNCLYRCHERGGLFYWEPSYQYSALRVCNAFAESLEPLLTTAEPLVVSSCYDQIRFRCRFAEPFCDHGAIQPVAQRTISLFKDVFFDHLGESMLDSPEKPMKERQVFWSQLTPGKIVIGPPDGQPAPLEQAMDKLKSAMTLLPTATSIKCAYVTSHSILAPATHQDEAERIAVELGLPRPDVRYRGFFSEVCIEPPGISQATK